MLRVENKPIALIVDDSLTNRMLLGKILSADFQIEQAENGEIALQKLRALSNVAVVILDIEMPVLNGFGVLDAMRADERLREIPVVVDTIVDNVENQLRALDAGAVDILIKPFNPQIALHRVRNIIARRESERLAAHSRTLEALLRQSEIDDKTGIFNKWAFCRKTAELLRDNPDEAYMLLRSDIDHFKVLNDVFGVNMGDAFLKRIGKLYRENMPAGCTFGHWEADHFVSCVPRAVFESGFIAEHIMERITGKEIDFEYVVRLGVYEISDPTLDVELMCDRALLALRSIKGNYAARVAFYNDSMRAALLEEQEIVHEMRPALENGQFEPWFQPQYNHATGELIGAEALVRWRHPTRGVMSPGVFIPIFERNGFIYELDKYVWEQACMLLRKWADAGYAPLPISVNISRHDIFHEDFYDFLTGLITQYGIPVELLRLEITESAFAGSTEQIVSMVRRLIAFGFEVEIDDFGSGYSSLNTLKDVPATILKLDMKFLEGSDNNQRGGNIISSIVRMAKWLGMTVIAEGVETKAHADYLKSIGCSYVQGYYYARPMPEAAYEALVSTDEKRESMRKLETVATLDNNAFWDPKSMDTLIFNSYVGGACIFEYHDGAVELLRVNDKFLETYGGSLSNEDVFSSGILSYMDEPNRNAFLSCIQHAIDTNSEAACETVAVGLFGIEKRLHIRTCIRVIARSGGSYLCYASVLNVTDQREAERKERELASRISAIMDNADGGITAISMKDERLSFIFSNDRYYSQLGYTRAQFDAEIENALDIIHPEDRAGVQERLLISFRDKLPVEFDYRCRKRDGEYIDVRCNAVVSRLEGVDGDVLISIVTDISELVRAQREANHTAAQLEAIMESINGGVTAIVLEGEQSRLLFANERFYAQLGYTKSQFEAEVSGFFGQVHPEDRARLVAEAESVNSRRSKHTATYRALRRDGSVRWMRSSISVAALPGDERPVQIAVSIDVTDELENELKMNELINAIPGGVAIYRIGEKLETLYSSDGMAKLTGVSAERYASMREGDIIAYAVYREDIEPLRARIAADVAADRPINATFRLKHKNGGVVWVMLSAAKIREDSKGKIYYAVFSKPTDEAANQIKLTEQIVEALMRIDYESVVTIDAQSGEATPIITGHIEQVIHEQKREEDYVGGVEAYIRKHSVGEDAERIIRETSLPYVKERLASAPVHAVCYSLRQGNKLVSKRVVYAYLGENQSTILCAMRNLSETEIESYA